MTTLGQGKIDFLTDIWTDLRITPGAFQFAGASDPTLSNWQPGGAGATFKIFEFNNNDEAFFTAQIPHSYKQGTDIQAHIHWTPRARGVAENAKTVAWKIDYSIANVDTVFPSSTTIDLTDTCSGTNELQEVSGLLAITGTTFLISFMLIGRIYRDAGDTWATNTPGNLPCLLEVDFHYQLDTVGSDEQFSKTNKNA